MAKKVVKTTVTEEVHEETPAKKKKTTRKTTSTGEKKKRLTARERDELLLENFVGLQHAMTNLSIKFGTLSDNITQLLRVFEEAAKGFIKGEGVDNTEMITKINSLLDQNKTIAKGLVLMEEKLRNDTASRMPITSERPNTTPPVSLDNSTAPVKPRPLPRL